MQDCLQLVQTQWYLSPLAPDVLQISDYFFNLYMVWLHFNFKKLLTNYSALRPLRSKK